MRKTAIRKSAWPALAVLALLALGGCSGGNIGSSWQCPLAQGGTCDSVAGADPAVAQAASAPQTASVPAAVSAPGAARIPVPGKPLYLVREERQAEAATPCRAECEGGFDPFGWLARLFGAEDGDPRTETAVPAANASVQSPAPLPSPEPETVDLPADLDPSDDDLPAEPQPGPDDQGDGLRTEEVVARIWIAPFVDANGVYREASHVRVVLEPAGWRVP